MKRLFLYLTIIFFPGLHLTAQTLKIAVAANAQFVMKALQADFLKISGIKIDAIIASSGKLTAQIANGAPFDLFLSADMDFPRHLYQKGFALTQPKVYAYGSLIICSSTMALDSTDWQKVLLKPSATKIIALANPSIAPYGKAAEEALTAHQLLKKLKGKLVYGESISQVNTYISTGTAQIGFTTEALAVALKNKRKLFWVRVDPKTYSPIQQGLVLLSPAKQHYVIAKKFYDYLLSNRAKAIFKQYGYRITEH